jgi:hypothetical protein
VGTDYSLRGSPFRNASDVMKQYTFKYVRRVNIITLGRSENSQFDFGVSVSGLSTKTWDALSIVL